MEVRARLVGNLGDAPGGDTAIISADLFSEDQMSRRALSLADSQVVVKRAKPVTTLLRRVEQNRASLLRSYDLTVADIGAERPITPSAEWLVDNFHAVEQQIRQIRKDMPRGYFRLLPKLGPGFLEGHPRVFGIVWAYVAHTDSNLDADQLGRFVGIYESRQALSLGELWAVPIHLRIVLVENLRRVAELMVDASRDRQRADRVADRLLGLEGEAVPLAVALPSQDTFKVSRSFIVQMMRRLTEHRVEDALHWLDRVVMERGWDVAELIQGEHQSQAAAAVTMRNIFRSLRLLTDVNWEDWLESVSLLEEELRTSRTYPASDFGTRNLYRSAIEELARGSGQAEIAVARLILSLVGGAPDDVGREVGYWLMGEGRRHLESLLRYRPPWRQRWLRLFKGGGLIVYLLTAAVLTLALALALVWLMAGLAPSSWSDPWVIVLALLAVVPASDVVLAAINRATTRILPAMPLPGLHLSEGVPEELRTLVAVPTLLTSPDGVEELLDALEVHFLGNDSGELYFAALTDWADSEIEVSPADEALLAAATDGIRVLNEKYPDRFFLFHRRRVFNPSEGVWMGWERKRGKLQELNRLLRGATDTTYLPFEGRMPGPFRYVITLDSDTQLPRDAARRLVEKLAHPLNRARLDREGKVVEQGYAILQPRVTPSLPVTEDTSLFQAAYTTPRGLHPYAFPVSDVYQDFFGEGSFAGKGIYDIDALSQLVEGRIPQNRVLSHDLLEGNLARSGVVSDVEVVEGFPTSYEVSMSRDLRWTRGDWQLLPWAFGSREPISALGRWKILDNLRRSLVPVMLVLGFLIALASPMPVSAVAWLGLMALVLYAVPLWSAISELIPIAEHVTLRSHVAAVAADLGRALVLGSLNLVFLAHRAVAFSDAIVRTLWRMAVSRRHLLEWTTAAAAQQQARGTLSRFLRLMAPGLVPAVLALAIAAARGWTQLAIAVAPAMLWLFAPVIACQASRIKERVELAPGDEALADLRLVARRTWEFFVAFVTVADRHLPPDNYQESPKPLVAHRTSPTNIGLYLLSVVSAKDFGWIGVAEACDRLDATLNAMVDLEHESGHLYNWYDTQTGQPLEPRYISSVDSGNLAGHLLTLANTCAEWRADPTRATCRPPGILDGLALVRATMPSEVTVGSAPLLGHRLDSVEQAIRRLTDRAGVAELASLEALVESLDGVPGLDLDAHASVAALAATIASQRRDRALTPEQMDGLVGRLQQMETLTRDAVNATDFTLLLDPSRKLLSVGYQVAERQRDDSCYDLLASECRLASFVGIAKGDLPARHWARLGRGMTAAIHRAVLLSWSGSMFEYLMPALVMRSPAQGLLTSTCRRVVRRQQQYGLEKKVPWGVSESGYNARDRDLNYQYSPFGVPGLGIVRGLADNLVVAPYATALAAMFEPDQAAKNFRALATAGGLGRYGYYEAIDFTSRRVPRGEKSVVIRSHMAHHQGMTIVAINNVIHDEVMRERFHAEPMVRAAELLLQERAPRWVPVVHARRDEAVTTRVIKAVLPPSERTFLDAAALDPAIHLMSNGRLTSLLTPAGGGQLRWQGLAITRWHPDPIGEATGDYLYLRDERSGDVWSTGLEPCLAEPDSYEVRFAEDRATFQTRRRNWETVVDHHVSPEADAAAKRLVIRNLGPRPGSIRVTSYAELVLAATADDDAHPAFSKMFVQTEFLPRLNAIIATRRRRSASDPQVWVAHFVVPGAGTGPLAVLAETDRAAFLGRNRTPREPQRPHSDSPGPGATGFTLDPILSLSVRVEVADRDPARLMFWTVVGETRDQVIQLIEQHSNSAAHDRVAMLSWTTSQVQLRYLGLTHDDAAYFQRLAGHALYPDLALRASPAALAAARSQADLWPLGISGDLPLVVLRIDDPADLELARQVLMAANYWHLKRFDVDVVLLNDRATSYVQELQQSLQELAMTTPPGPMSHGAGQVFLLQRDQLATRCSEALMAAAAVVLIARRGDLATQLRQASDERSRSRWRGRPRRLTTRSMPTASIGPLLYHNGFGGFDPDTGEYVVRVSVEEPTPAPWINVLANSSFGTLTSADGVGNTWWRNSRDNQLTPWRNDPVSSPVSEAIYVRDDLTGEVTSATMAPMHDGTKTARHGFGYTRYTHATDNLELEQTVFVAPEDPVKLSLIRVTNTSPIHRTITVISYAQPVLGMDLGKAQRHLVTAFDDELRVLTASNPWGTQFPGQLCFVDHAGLQESWTADRREFLGVRGSTDWPRSLTSAQLSGAVGAGLDPCLAMQHRIRLAPGETHQGVVLLGAAGSPEQLAELVIKYRGLDPEVLLEEVRDSWRSRLTRIEVNTPDTSFNLMMNGWLLYQTLACRMLARSGFYQASGAYGFRDQLQDSMSIVLTEPALARTHLLKAAARQFLDGDVQHWWLPETGAGIRSRISDDPIWLAAAAARYLVVTGDTSILDEPVDFLDGDALAEGEAERYFRPTPANRPRPLYDHCVLALTWAFPTGRHGLPLIGTGDWNDGMNRVGAGGAGESTWLGWFLHTTLGQFLPIAEARGDAAFVAAGRSQQERLLVALETDGWDGQWYRRGYFDDGTPLGSSSRPECRIDSIAQSWAVLSGAAQPERAMEAMEQAHAQLVLPDQRISKLFTPPFDTSEPDPGYVRAYPPGVRENGGQYTHGATWSVFAWAALGRRDRAAEVFALLNPVNHALTTTTADTYRVEPYVVAADIYGEPPLLGRGGWTWYTGSAGWLYRAGLEAILGLHQQGHHLVIKPYLPRDWPQVSVRYRHGTATYDLDMRTDGAEGQGEVGQLILDGRELAVIPDARILLVDDGNTHWVTVRIDGRSNPRSDPAPGNAPLA